MIPFNVKMGKHRVGISWESLFWFFVVTAGATVVGELVYQKWVQPYLSKLPNLPTPTPRIVQLPPSTGSSTVVSVQTPQQNAKT